MILYLIRKTLILTRFDKFGHNSLTPSETYFANVREAKGTVGHNQVHKISKKWQIYEQNDYNQISNKNGLDIGPIYPKIFKFLPYVNCFKDLHFQIFRDFLWFQIALTRLIFELEKLSLFLNRSECCQKLIGYVIGELHRQKYILCRQN